MILTENDVNFLSPLNNNKKNNKISNSATNAMKNNGIDSS